MAHAVFGLLGHPVAHSISPALHGALLGRLGIAGNYHAFDVPPTALREAITGARALSFAGLNVTVPHKEAALALADEVAESARAVGAANTLKFEPSGVVAHNTDAAGFLRSIEHEAGSLKGRVVAVLGAGGAARSVVAAAIGEGAERVLIYNRTSARAASLAAEFSCEAAEISALGAGGDGWIVVNATSVGMHPDGGASPLAPELMHPGNIYVDLVYNPLRTGFLETAERKGARTVDGLGMLIWQAVYALEIWLERRLDVTDFVPALREKLVEELTRFRSGS